MNLPLVGDRAKTTLAKEYRRSQIESGGGLVDGSIVLAIR